MAYRFEKGNWILKTPNGERLLSSITQGQESAFYLYDLDDAVERARRFLESGFTCHYAMKANSHDRLLRKLADMGMGADVVSLGELQKALRSGFPPERIIFSGVGKDRPELELALASQIYQINVESFEELQLLNQIALEKNVTADIAVRVNIHLEAPTHKNIQTSTSDSKFGLDQRQLPDVLTWLRGKERLRLKSLAVHIGSQIEDLAVFARMVSRMNELYQDVKASGIDLERLDFGGGLGIDYRTNGEEDFSRLDDYLEVIRLNHKTNAKVLLEPGRFVVARMGVLLTKVIYVKQGLQQKFVIVNSGMNHLMRPALYQAYHRIEPITFNPEGRKETYTVVGPICESTDKFAEGREMPAVQRGDWLAIFDTGAYGAVMANHYNESPLPKQLSLLDAQMEVM